MQHIEKKMNALRNRVENSGLQASLQMQNCMVFLVFFHRIMGRPDLLNLSRHVSERNVRKRIFSHLHSYDIELVMCAHNTKRGFAFNSDFSLFCAEHGYISLMQWALGYQCPWDYDAAVVAARNGHIEFLKWATLNTRMSRA